MNIRTFQGVTTQNARKKSEKVQNVKLYNQRARSADNRNFRRGFHIFSEIIGNFLTHFLTFLNSDQRTDISGYPAHLMIKMSDPVLNRA